MVKETVGTEESSTGRRAAILGGISLILFCAGAVVAFVTAEAGRNLSGEEGMGSVFNAAVWFLGGSVLAVASGAGSLIRRESPRWPAVTSLALGAIPVAYGLLSVIFIALGILTANRR